MRDEFRIRREQFRDRLVPRLIGRIGVAPAPFSRFLLGQRADLMRQLGIGTVLDVGGNVGQYATELRLTGFSGTIHTFEPGAEAWAVCAAVAKADARWHVHKVALSESNGRATLNNRPGLASTVASLRSPSQGVVDMVGAFAAEDVETLRLGTWLADHPDVDPGITHLKLDVQGSEREVFLGAGPTLGRFAMVEFEAPLTEWYDGEATLGELLDLLRDAGIVPASIMTERFNRAWRGAADVDVLAIRSDLSRVPAGIARA